MDGIMTVYELLQPWWVVWLMLLFLGIVAWVFWPKNKQRIESYGMIPLADEDPKD